MISEESSSFSMPEESDHPRTKNRRNKESMNVYLDHNQCEQGNVYIFYYAVLNLRK